MGAPSLCIAAAAQYLVCAVIYLRSQFKMLRVHASRIVAFVSNNHSLRNLAFVHEVRGSVSRHTHLSKPERACAASAVPGVPEPTSILGNFVFLVKALLRRYFWPRIDKRIFARPVAKVMLCAKAKALMLPSASFDGTQSHDSLSVVVLRNFITTPNMGEA